MGTTQFLKSMNPEIKTIAVEPQESPVLSGGQKGPHKITGIGPGFIPDIVDPKVIDEIQQVPSNEAHAMARRMALEEGLMVGPSSGAAVYAAL